VYWQGSRVAHIPYMRRVQLLRPITGSLKLAPFPGLKVEEAFVESPWDDVAGGNAFNELVSMAIEVDPSLAEQGAKAIANGKGGLRVL